MPLRDFLMTTGLPVWQQPFFLFAIAFAVTFGTLVARRLAQWVPPRAPARRGRSVGETGGETRGNTAEPNRAGPAASQRGTLRPMRGAFRQRI